MRPEDLQATYCATLVDEWVRNGIVHAVVSPGSRSTPLALALLGDARIAVHVILDERSAAFAALGIGQATGHPALVVTTSGTAAAQLHPAVIEADLAGVSMIVVTADRPPDLRDIGAAQTIDQNRLYGGSVRWFCDPGPPDEATKSAWRSIATHGVIEAIGRRPGPVHMNIALREPLVGTTGPLPPGRSGGRPWHHASRSVLMASSMAELDGARGIVVAGAGSVGKDVLGFAKAMGWPVLADPCSGIRWPASGVVAAADALLRINEVVEALRPEMVIRTGAPWASKVLGQWLARSGAIDVLVDPHGHVRDPYRTADVRIDRMPKPGEPAPEAWLAQWMQLEDGAQSAIDATLSQCAGASLSEPAIARSLLAALPDGSDLFVSSSMPIRDVEWFGAPRRGVRVLANRGANGIDGVTSTALGVALARRGGAGLTAALLGDLAFLHDLSGLVSVANSGAPLCLVVVVNHGGGIFEFLPQAQLVERDAFERLFGTPQSVDVAAVARGAGLVVKEVTSVADLITASVGPGVVVVRTDRVANVVVHDEINDAVRLAALRVLKAWAASS